VNNPYGYYELEYHQTKEGIEEQDQIDYICNQWKNVMDDKRRLMRLKKIYNILKRPV
jgi:hypothetical protein